MQYIGDTKAGTLIGIDRYGNKYFENLAEELPLRTRWVDFREKEYDPSQIEPGWHAWTTPPKIGNLTKPISQSGSIGISTWKLMKR